MLITYNNFEESGKEVYEVTLKDWIIINKDLHVNQCKEDINEFNNITVNECKLYHKENIIEAIKKNKKIPEDVLKDYKELKEQIQKQLEEQKQKELSKFIITSDFIKTLKKGVKLTINNNYKYTVHEVKEDAIILKVYRSKTKGILIPVGEKLDNLIIGW